MSKTLGFVGLGTMGFPMAVNLKKAGFEVVGYDGFKNVYQKATAAGITMVKTLKEVAEHADEAIISTVRDHAQNADIIFGEGGLLSAQPCGKRWCFRCSSWNIIDYDIWFRRHRESFPTILCCDGIEYLLLWRETRKQPSSKIS
jgi:3-hydroxyisobutyrate dehydrogenase-like beta-hydroxyacid dehydrogenase